MSRLGLGFFVAAALVMGGQTPDLDAVLERASAYVEHYEPALGMLIAEERYRQWVPAYPRYEERRTLSDFLMLRLPSADDRWIGFRVVVEVDGREVRDRMDRLQTLLNGPTDSAIAEWRALADESARFNLADVMRSTNVPTFALAVLYREHRDRFEFEQVETDRVEGRDVWVIRFREVGNPTLIIDPVRRVQVPSRGRLWIDPADGRVVRTEFLTGRGSLELHSEVVVRYRPDDDLGVWVPRDMREHYHLDGHMLFRGQARYRDYQRYGVSVDEQTTEPTERGR